MVWLTFQNSKDKRHILQHEEQVCHGDAYLDIKLQFN